MGPVTRSNTEQLTFSAGEISPLLYGRTDYQRVQSGMRQCRGFIPLRQGGFTRAPGTRFRGNTRGDAEARLVSFQFAADDSVVLEFTPLRMRVWRYGFLVMSGGSPYELVTPYDAAAIWRLRWVQSADVIYFVDGARPVQRLARLALNNWTIGAAAFRRGPFDLENEDEAVTVKAAVSGGVVTLTGVGGPFPAGIVGTQIQLRAVDDEIPTWTGNTNQNTGELVRYDGRIYENLTGDDTGVNPPIHHGGRVKVNRNGPIWRYVSDDVGIVRIDARASSNSATGVLVKRLPPAVIEEGTWRWSLSAWSDVKGWPSAITIYDQRLVLAATPSDPRTLWFSTAGDLLDFEAGTEADSAFGYTIAAGNAGTVNRILWMEPGSRGLHIGALGAEYSSRSTTKEEVIGATNLRFELDATVGSHTSAPIAPDGRPIFISRDRARVCELRYAFDEDATRAIELSLPSEHLGADPFVEVAWQASPLRLAWFRRESGEMAVLVHDPNEDVLGWAPYSLAGGICESLCVSGGEDGRSDLVMLVVRRTVGGVTRRFIEQVSLFYGILTGEYEIRSANHMFASAVKIEPTPFTAVGGLGHLEGEVVRAWTDHGDLGEFTVAGGAIDLGYPVRYARVGLFDASHVAETLDVAGPVREGSGLGRQKRVKALGLRWHLTCAAEARMVEREFGKEPVSGAWVDAARQPVPRDLVSGWSGVVNINAPSGHAPEVTCQFRPVGGAPMTLLAATPIVDTAGG